MEHSHFSRAIPVFAVTAALALFFGPIRVSSGQETIKIGGTGGALGAMNFLAREFERTHPGRAVRILPSLGSSGGIKAVNSGALDIGLSSRPLNESEHTVAARAYGRTPFVFAVKKSHRLTGLTIPDLVALYSGAKRTWPNNKVVRIVLRPVTEYDIVLLKSMSPEMDRAVTQALRRQGMIIATTDQDSADAIEQVPGAIGTTTLAQIISEKRALKALTLNGVRPGLAALADGSYPYFKTHYLVTSPSPRREVREFIDFVYTEAGRKILARIGYQPVR